MDTNILVAIEQKLIDLARARREYTQHGQTLKELIEQLEANPFYQTASQQQEIAKDQIERISAEIKALAVEAYDGENKTITAGVKIQERTVAKLLDEEAARKYAFDNAPGYLKLDETGMARLAAKLAGTPASLPFFQIQKEPSATIATDLDKILIEASATF